MGTFCGIRTSLVVHESKWKIHVGTTEFDHKLAGMAQGVCLMKVVADRC